MHKRVLLPLDGSTMAEQALPYAVEQAEPFRSELVLRCAQQSCSTGSAGTNSTPLLRRWPRRSMRLS